VDEDGRVKAGIYTSVGNDLQDQYFVDYRPFGGSFYGRFFTQSLDETTGQYEMDGTYTAYSSDLDLSKSYDPARTSPIESTFSYQFPKVKGFPDGHFNYPSVKWTVEGGVSGTDSMYLGVRWSADADPAPYVLTAYQRATIEDTYDTYYEYRTVSSFPTTLGYTFSNMTAENDDASHNAALFGMEMDVGGDQFLPLHVDRWTLTFILQTPDGSPVTPSTGAFGSFEISTYSTSHRFNWFETQDQYRQITKQTPISEHDGTIYATRD
jgi:hypothetical protein